MKKLFSKLKDPKVYSVVIIVFTAVVIIILALFLETRDGRVFIDNSLIAAPIATISPDTSGKLIEMDAYEGEMVKKGDPLGVVGTEIIRANSDGEVVVQQNQIGGIVTPQTPLVQIIDPTMLRVSGTIDENKGLSDIKIGQVASFTVDALPGKTFWGYVDEISPTAKQTALSFTISTERPVQQFLVYVKFDANTYPQIKNGMSAKLTVYTKTH